VQQPRPGRFVDSRAWRRKRAGGVERRCAGCTAPGSAPLASWSSAAAKASRRRPASRPGSAAARRRPIS